MYIKYIIRYLHGKRRSVVVRWSRLILETWFDSLCPLILPPFFLFSQPSVFSLPLRVVANHHCGCAVFSQPSVFSQASTKLLLCRRGRALDSEYHDPGSIPICCSCGHFFPLRWSSCCGHFSSPLLVLLLRQKQGGERGGPKRKNELGPDT